MSTVQHSTVVGVFETRAQAEVAVDYLWHEGFPHKDVGFAAPGQPAHVAETAHGQTEATAAHGAVTGAVAGGTVGAVAGALIAGLIPGIGPILVGGLLTGIVTGAAAGAAGGTFLGPFLAMGFSEEQAHGYMSNVRAGRTVVVVNAGDRSADAEAILRENGAIEVS